MVRGQVRMQLQLLGTQDQLLLDEPSQEEKT